MLKSARCDSSIAGSFSARNSGGGDVSSGNRSSPSAISAGPSAGAAVATASGIESSGPPAMNRAQGSADGAVAASSSTGASPIRVCGQNWRNASDHGTA